MPIAMSIANIGAFAALAALAAFSGWVLRGKMDKISRKREQQAWKKNRIFMPNRTTKS
jgi:hypothetical protein